MIKTDRFLWAIVAAIGLLAVAALALFFLRRGSQEYSLENTPQAALRNYILALEKRDYQRAYELLVDAPGKPDFERFRQDFITRMLDPSNAALSIQHVSLSGEQAVVDVVLIFSRGGPFAHSYRSVDSALLRRDETGDWKIARLPYPFWGYDWYSPAMP